MDNTIFPVWGTGKRKTSIARIRVVEGKGKLIINGKTLNDYFKGLPIQQNSVLKPLNLVKDKDKYNIIVKVEGGGFTGQADAIKLAIARAFVKINPELRSIMAKEGLLRRDSRIVERKKPGRPKARKRFQYSKR